MSFEHQLRQEELKSRIQKADFRGEWQEADRIRAAAKREYPKACDWDAFGHRTPMHFGGIAR